VIIIDGARKRSIAIVLPRARAPLVVGDDDHVEISVNHVDHVLRAQVTDTFQIAPTCVRMEIADQRKMREVRQKLFDPARGSPVLLHTRVTPVGCLVRDGMFDDVTVTGVAITKKQAEALPLVDLNRRYKEGPEGV